MKKKILSTAIALSLMSGVVAAEQPKATEYRNIMSSGKFYLEYKTGIAKQAIAVNGDKRMTYTFYDKGVGALGLIPGVALIGMFVKNDALMPNALYQNDRYYHFTGKKSTLVANDKELRDPNIDPEEGWQTIHNDLTFPEVFMIFAPNDKEGKAAGYVVPKFIESGQEEIKGTTYTFDKYAKTNKNSAGNVSGETFFYLYYDAKGELARIRTKFFADGKEESIPYSEIKVRKILPELPKDVLEIPNGTKVFAAGMGDMNDLLDNPVLVEKVGKDDSKD